MKAQKIVIFLASLVLLASCGGNGSSSASSSDPTTSSSAAKKTMNFLKDGQYYMDVPNNVVASSDPEKTPRLRINGTSVRGDLKDDLGGKFELIAEGTFVQDLYVTVAKSGGEGHISAKAYGPIDKAAVNEALTIISSGEVPNKVFVAFSTTKASWPKGLDEEMDQEIEAVWGLLG